MSGTGLARLKSFSFTGLFYTNPMKHSLHETSMLAGVNEQMIPYKIQDDKLVVIQ